MPARRWCFGAGGLPVRQSAARSGADDAPEIAACKGTNKMCNNPKFVPIYFPDAI